MSSYRKRDDLTGYLYRVVQRVEGSDEWEHSDCYRYGKPRTYMTLGAARGQCTYARDQNARYGGDVTREFAVQRAPVTDWEMVPDE